MRPFFISFNEVSIFPFFFFLFLLRLILIHFVTTSVLSRVLFKYPFNAGIFSSGTSGGRGGEDVNRRRRGQKNNKIRVETKPLFTYQRHFRVRRHYYAVE